MNVPLDCSIILENIGKAYGTRRVLSGVSRTVISGKCLGIVGANGSGKSTLLKIVAGLLRPSRGVVSLHHNGSSATESCRRRELVGYCAPDLALYPELSGAENLKFFAEARGAAITDREIERRLGSVGLSGRGKDMVSVYSSGMKQRLRLAFALRDGLVPFLLLDEPSLALDSGGVTLVEDAILRQKDRGGVILLATNDARELAWTDETFSVEALR